MGRKSLSKRTRFEIFKRDRFQCVHCGATPNEGPLHVDHMVAVANGGSDDPINLVTSCADCNLGKAAVPLEAVKLRKGKATQADLEHAEQLRDAAIDPSPDKPKNEWIDPDAVWRAYESAGRLEHWALTYEREERK